MNHLTFEQDYIHLFELLQIYECFVIFAGEEDLKDLLESQVK